MKYELYDNAELVFIDKSFNGTIRLTARAALLLCDIAINYKCYIDLYECGIWHFDKNSYEGHDLWSAGKKSFFSDHDIIENNLLAKESIICDIEDGYTVFEIKIKNATTLLD